MLETPPLTSMTINPPLTDLYPCCRHCLHAQNACGAYLGPDNKKFYPPPLLFGTFGMSMVDYDVPRHSDCCCLKSHPDFLNLLTEPIMEEITIIIVRHDSALPPLSMDRTTIIVVVKVVTT